MARAATNEEPSRPAPTTPPALFPQIRNAIGGKSARTELIGELGYDVKTACFGREKKGSLEGLIGTQSRHLIGP